MYNAVFIKTHLIRSMLDGTLSSSQLGLISNWNEEELVRNLTELLEQLEQATDVRGSISEGLQAKKQHKKKWFIDELEQYIAQKMYGELTLRMVAEHFSYSPNHLGVIFKELMGDKFSSYVIRKRLERARELLQNPYYKVYEIADQLGYKNLTYFSRQFKEFYGVTPSAYRRQS